MIIGEDLGTVPEGLRERMHEMQMFGCSILPFERSGDARFRSPAEYRRRSMASAGTHDLPTIRCYWRGDDIDLRERLGLQNAQASVQARAQRAEDRTSLLAALVQAGSLRNEAAPTVEELRDALHSFLSASAAGLFAAQLDDLLDEEEQLNVPGTVDSYPNWRRKLSAALEDRRLTHALAGLALLARRAGRV